MIGIVIAPSRNRNGLRGGAAATDSRSASTPGRGFALDCSGIGLCSNHCAASRVQRLAATVIEVFPASRTLRTRRMTPDQRDRRIRSGSREGTVAIEGKILAARGLFSDL